MNFSKQLILKYIEFDTPDELCLFFSNRADVICISVIYTNGFTAFYYELENKNND